MSRLYVQNKLFLVSSNGVLKELGPPPSKEELEKQKKLEKRKKKKARSEKLKLQGRKLEALQAKKDRVPIVGGSIPLNAPRAKDFIGSNSGSVRITLLDKAHNLLRDRPHLNKNTARFIKSLITTLSEGRDLTFKQQDVLERIFEKESVQKKKFPYHRAANYMITEILRSNTPPSTKTFVNGLKTFLDNELHLSNSQMNWLITIYERVSG